VLPFPPNAFVKVIAIPAQRNPQFVSVTVPIRRAADSAHEYVGGVGQKKETGRNSRKLLYDKRKRE